MRVVDVDRLLQGYEDHDYIDTHIIWNAPTVDAIPISWIEGLHKTAQSEEADMMIDEIISLWEARKFGGDVLSPEGIKYGRYGGDAVPVIRCKDCKHRPKHSGDEGNGFDIEFPDETCPCQCDDPWFNWIPNDEWYCANGERRDE